MSEAVKQIVGQAGWEEIEAIFDEEISNSKKLLDIKTDDKTNEQLGEIYRARQEASRIIKRIISRIRREGSNQTIKSESYK